MYGSGQRYIIIAYDCPSAVFVSVRASVNLILLKVLTVLAVPLPSMCVCLPQ